MSKPLIRPTDTEDRSITANAYLDPDNQPLSTEELQQFKRGKGRPAGSQKKQVSLRLDLDILEAFKAQGQGWQTRINAVLREWVRQH